MSAFDIRRLTSIAISAVLLAVSAAGAHADDKLVAGSLGGRVVELLWVPERSNWPAGGWRLERVAGSGSPAVVAERIVPGGDRAAMAKLKPEEARGVQTFADKLKRGTLTDKERESADVVFLIAAVTKPDYGRALGLRYRDTRAPAGTVRYRLVALDSAGKTIRTVESKPLDANQRAPLPRPPDNASVDFAGEGLVVSWSEPSLVEAAPVVGYRVLRIENNRPTNLTPELLLRSKNADTPRVNFFDREAPRDRAFTYVLTSIDLFGRSSPPSRVEVPLDRLARAIAPTGLAAIPGEESASLTWDGVPHPGVRGYALERSLFVGGPYEVATRDGLPVDTLAYTDENLRGATTYYYRVRIVDAGGELGVPSLPVRVVPLASAAPAAPTGLNAEAGKTRVQLSWDEAPSPVAGYFVFRKLESEREWKRLNGVVTPESVYRDRFEVWAYGGITFLYRVQAIGFDDREGAFSEPVRVVFDSVADLSAPHITDASGEGGVARLTFESAAPKNSARFLLLRSDAEDSPSAVIGGAIPADQRAVSDPDVTAGASYRYELVAVDGDGNRSDPSNRVIVTIGAPDLPAPPKPAASFRARPFPYVSLALRTIPPKLVAVIEARDASGKWLEVAGPVAAAGTVNLTHLPEGVGSIDFRVVFLAANGARSQPSEPVTVQVGGR